MMSFSYHTFNGENAKIQTHAMLHECFWTYWRYKLANIHNFSVSKLSNLSPLCLCVYYIYFYAYSYTRTYLDAMYANRLVWVQILWAMTKLLSSFFSRCPNKCTTQLARVLQISLILFLGVTFIYDHLSNPFNYI